MNHSRGEFLGPARDARVLPGWTLPVSLVGLAILLVSTLPALVARRRLEAAERRALDEIRALEASTERFTRDTRALQTDGLVFDRARRELLEPGPRVALPSSP
jgi:hypothetical protein